ncbi:MAG: hypothetical protein HZY79_13800 [Rhodoblastus sp.]|nr:MAG: hypothetical protein HZY79_13800 [Rhodoblastus sp.]
MGPFSTVVLIAAFDGLKWLFAVTAGLLALLTAVQAWRGDADAKPATTLTLMILFAVGALLCRWLGRWLERQTRGV